MPKAYGLQINLIHQVVINVASPSVIFHMNND